MGRTGVQSISKGLYQVLGQYIVAGLILGVGDDPVLLEDDIIWAIYYEVVVFYKLTLVLILVIC